MDSRLISSLTVGEFTVLMQSFIATTKVNSTKVQCAGQTKKNERCKKSAISDGKCSIHGAKSITTEDKSAVSIKSSVAKCTTTTKAGEQCKRKATNGVFCTQHAKSMKSSPVVADDSTIDDDNESDID